MRHVLSIGGLSALALLLGAAGCRESPPPVDSSELELEEARARAVAEAEREEALGPGGYQVASETLEAFLRYQRRMIDVYGALVRESQRLMGRADGGLATAQQATRVLAGKAQAEAQARKELGLTQTDVRMLSAMATEIASRRSLAKALRLEDSLAELEEAKVRLGPSRQEELDRQIESLREQERDLIQLREAREKWGDANVDLLLTREDALNKNYQDMLAQFAGPEAAPGGGERGRDAGARDAGARDAAAKDAAAQDAAANDAGAKDAAAKDAATPDPRARDASAPDATAEPTPDPK